MRERTARAAALVLVASAASLAAHDLSTSESRVTAAGPLVRARLSFDLLAIPGVDANADRKVSYDELDDAIERVFAVVQRHYQITAGGAPPRVTLERHELADDHGVTLELSYTFAADVRRLQVTSTLHEIAAPSHQHLVTATFDGTPQRAMLSAAYPRATFEVDGASVGSVAAGGAVVALVLLLGAQQVVRWRRARSSERR